MNKVILKGNLGQDPEVKSFDWGKVAKFSLATSESYKNKAGEKVTETTWHNIVFKGNVCDTIEKYFKKGDQILIEGKLVYRSYKDQQEKQHWFVEVVCDNFEFCGSSKKDEKPANKEGQLQKGKVNVTSMSDPALLGSAEDDPSYDPNLPF
jgi:single-strand DNA-binding protein